MKQHDRQGALYLLSTVAAGVPVIYVSNTLTVGGNATATARNTPRRMRTDPRFCLFSCRQHYMTGPSSIHCFQGDRPIECSQSSMIVYRQPEQINVGYLLVSADH